MGRFARRFTDFYRAISSDIFKFCEALNFVPTWQQAQLLEMVQRAQLGQGTNRIGVKSGQGPGKTTVSVVIGLWRTLQAVNALTIVTAPTMRQCKDVWLVEARRRLEKADPILQQFITITKTKVEVAGMPDWGVKLVTATREENAQGYHQENMTVIGEEASGIPREMITQFKGTLSNPDALFLLIGNPNTRDCAFFDCFHSQRHRWGCLTFNAEETARDYPHIVSPERNKDLEDEFGRDSDVYRIRVLGEFPHADPNCVLSSEEIERVMGVSQEQFLAAAMTPRVTADGARIAKQFGIDFARFGGDESVIYRRHGQALVEWLRFAHTEPSHVVDAAFKMQHSATWRDQDTWYVADAGGMGQGIMFRFYDAEKNILEFHNGGKAIDEQYDNKITEAWFQFARIVRSGVCALPKDQLLLQQLANRRYYTTRKGKLVLETKDEYMKRGYDSPDRADACVLAFYDEVLATGNITGTKYGSKTVGVR